MWRRAVRMASYYGRHELNKRDQRGLKAAIKRRLMTDLGIEPVCQRPGCGYRRYVGALEFHHPDGDLKDFTISMGNRRYPLILAEARKCRLLCSNCHKEEHGILRGKGHKTRGGRPRKTTLDPRIKAYLVACGLEHVAAGYA